MSESSFRDTSIHPSIEVLPNLSLTTGSSLCQLADRVRAQYRLPATGPANYNLPSSLSPTQAQCVGTTAWPGVRYGHEYVKEKKKRMDITSRQEGNYNRTEDRIDGKIEGN